VSFTVKEKNVYDVYKYELVQGATKKGTRLKQKIRLVPLLFEFYLGGQAKFSFSACTIFSAASCRLCATLKTSIFASLKSNSE
jgi:hypothetical protein